MGRAALSICGRDQTPAGRAIGMACTRERGHDGSCAMTWPTREASYGPATFDHALYSDKGGLILAGAAFALILLFTAAIFTLGWIVGYLR